ncbi:MAG: protein translocase subunit SecF [Ectothiorhodospiraceae bacterium]|nr:protein translocase subunit SecF [Ectothiorhodospiraceae bacterium]
MRILENLNIDFMSKRKLFYIVSLVIIGAGIVSVAVRGVALGLDFKGGTEVVVRLPHAMELTELRALMDDANLGSFVIKSFGTDTDYIIRTEQKGEGASISDGIKDYLASHVDGELEILQENRVEAKIGNEIRRDAIIAIFFALLGILAYISFRFKVIFAAGAVAALFHDVLIAFGLVSIFNGILPGLNLEFDQAMVAAFLTIVGYSINDTVVVFDRIRENLKISKTGVFGEILNKSINDTLSRTVLTSSTTMVAMLALLLFGGEPTRGFAFALCIGVITGTYSSIFVASALTQDWVIARKAKITF